MSKQLRIWLFALLGTLLATSSLLAEGVITMTTSERIGEHISLRIEATGNVTIEGVKESFLKDQTIYMLTSQTVIIRGDVTALDCSSNELTSLDASGHTALTTLDCSSNKLTSLDASGCTALTTLDCHYSQLISLNVSGCTSLTKLYCWTNRLTNLNVSGCTALIYLNCEDNQLTSLDVSGCTALTKLNCHFNRLISLNVSGCTALTKLDCNNNQLTSLDVSNHKALTTLDCSKNLLRKLELSGCTSILLLTCHLNHIKASEMANLVNSLPDLQGKGVRFFKVFYDGSAEGNVCLAAHVATAQAKGWKTQFTRDEYGYAWYDYSGADNPLYAVTSSSTGGGSISFTGADNLNAVPYGTTLTVVASPADGYKLTKLTANGQDILETQRFKVTENTEVKATFADHTGVETTVTQQVKLYPNPATDYVIVEGVAPASEVTLHSMTGEQLYTSRADSRGVLQIDLTPYADGVYLVCVAGETYRVVVRR